MKSRMPWIFVDGSTQQTFRIRFDVPEWTPAAESESAAEDVYCRFHITGDDGGAFDFQLEISNDVLESFKVESKESLAELIRGKGVEIVEGAIHKGVRGDQRLVWEPDGVSIIR